MEIKPQEAERFLASPKPELRAVLLYGPDAGLVAERAATLVSRICEDPTDPFRIAAFPASRLSDEPSLLADEAAAFSMTGGRRVVRVREAGNEHAEAFKSFFQHSTGDALVVVEAGDLAKGAALPALFGRTADVAAVACYRDDERARRHLIRTSLEEAGLSVNAEALAYLADHLGGDRRLTRLELEKLALYMGPDSQARAGQEVTLEDARASVGDSADLGLEDLNDALCEGRLETMERTLQRVFREGTSGVRVLRALAQHLMRLHLAQGLAAQGVGMKEVMTKRLRPQVFWKRQDSFERQCRLWSAEALASALARLLEAERACKRTGADDELIAGRCFFELAVRTRRRAAVRAEGARR